MPTRFDGPSALADLVRERAGWRLQGLRVVFANGCFDLLHAGHIELLEKARRHGDILIIGLNDDASIGRAKGPNRPVVPFEERAEVLGALRCVDRVVGFSEDTPEQLIEALVPDVLVKGADWELKDIVGRETVESAGGEVVRVELVNGRSSTDLIERIRAGRGAGG